jgi:hypothetical protein
MWKVLFGVLQIIASEARPQDYRDIVLSSTYYDITPEARPLIFYDKKLYRPTRNGKNCALMSFLLLTWEDIPS